MTKDQWGPNNHNWAGGMGRSTIERLTRRLLLQAGHSLFDCERCGMHSSEQELPRHHKDKDRSNNNLDNIEVICWGCHNKEHNKTRTRESNGRFI